MVRLAENLEPIALIGAGGVGKTSIALTVLHHDRIKQRFGDNRRFIRCDQFPPSLPHFLARLSKVIGANVENPEDLTPLRPILSSTMMFITFDNAESIFDPRGTNTREILAVVDELCHFKTICVCITSRTTTVPQSCKRPQIPALSMGAARDIFHGICGGGGQSGVIDGLLRRLNFHALSITLLAAITSCNTWDYDCLAEEWNTHRAQAPKADYNKSLAATIELSLASPTFRNLGSGARDLLGVVAFFPQGVDENNLDRFFSTTPDRQEVFDKFCALSLTFRDNGFFTMLAPIRDYLRLQDPGSSPLLRATKDHYFTRLSGHVDPDAPTFGETRWITSEDVNVEHLLDVFTSVDTNSADVWNACIYFMNHLYWHKPRRTILAPKIEALPDDHHSKSISLFQLSRLFGTLGNRTEYKRLLTCALGLERQQGDEASVAETLRELSDANRLLKLYEEGISQAREASEIFERFGNPIQQARCLNFLARSLLESGQLDAAETEASRMIDLIPEKGEEHLVCQSHWLLGGIYRSKGEREKAIHQFEIALGIASRFAWHDLLFSIRYDLAGLFRDEGEFDRAHAHVEQAKSHTINDTHGLGRVAEMLARIWLQQGKIEDAKAEALRALEIYEEHGATMDVEACRDLLRGLERKKPIRWFNAMTFWRSR